MVLAFEKAESMISILPPYSNVTMLYSTSAVLFCTRAFWLFLVYVLPATPPFP
jgi:hypothetical protein